MIACKSLSVFVLSPSLGFLGEGDIVSQTIHEAQQLLRGGQGPASRERDGSTRLVSQRLKAASTEHCLTHTHIYTLHFSSLRRGWSVAPGHAVCHRETPWHLRTRSGSSIDLHQVTWTGAAFRGTAVLQMVSSLSYCKFNFLGVTVTSEEHLSTSHFSFSSIFSFNLQDGTIICPLSVMNAGCYAFLTNLFLNACHLSDLLQTCFLCSYYNDTLMISICLVTYREALRLFRGLLFLSISSRLVFGMGVTGLGRHYLTAFAV